MSLEGHPYGLLAEYSALRRGCGAHDVPTEGVAVEGVDAAAYLQGQCSQDLAPLAVGGTVASLVLEPDGKLSALVEVTRTGDTAFVLAVEAGFGERLLSRLRRFRLRTKVEIEPIAWPRVALRGPGAAARPGTGPPFAVDVVWNGTAGVDLLGPGATAAVPEGAAWCGDLSWEALRVEAGIPAMGTELDDRTIAAEVGLVARAVSFTKGCYTGQELVARLDARGNRVARRLCGVVPADAAPTPIPGTPVLADDDEREVGRITSAAWCPGLDGPAALAYVHRSVGDGASVRLGSARWVVRPLPLVV